MKLIATSVLALATLAPLSLFAADPAPELSLKDAPQRVEINLGEGMLAFTAKLAATQDPDAAALLSGLKSVQVKIYDLSGDTRDTASARLHQWRQGKLDRSWTQMVTVSQPGEGDVVVFVKERNGEVVDGVVVTVLDPEGQGVMVHIDGELRAEQITRVMQKLPIEGLNKAMPTKL